MVSLAATAIAVEGDNLKILFFVGLKLWRSFHERSILRPSNMAPG
jgi:hypothetical protein